MHANPAAKKVYTVNAKFATIDIVQTCIVTFALSAPSG